MLPTFNGKLSIQIQKDTPNAIKIEVIVSNYVQRHKAQYDIEQTCYLFNFIIDPFSLDNRHNRHAIKCRAKIETNRH